MAGVFYINGEVPPTFQLNKNLEFELRLITGQKVICTIPKVIPGRIKIRIECVLQEDLKGEKIEISFIKHFFPSTWFAKE